MIDLEIRPASAGSDARIAVVTLNAPDKLNALDIAGLEELAAAYGRARDSRVRALVLRGEGRAFCAGRDIAGVDAATDDVPAYLDGALAPVLRAMSDFPAPTFAVAHGACLGVGLGLLIATDVVYVADTARIGSPFAALGATLDSGGHALLYERLGAHRALDLIYTGRLMSGAEAVASGLFSRAFPDGDVLDEAFRVAERAAEGATQAFLASKRIIRDLRDRRLGLWDAMALENRAQSALQATADYREGFAAFGEKRPPRFTGE